MLGGTPYILFKSNTTAAAGGLMAKMFHLYNLNRDEYLAHYHKRSNVETTNSMIKSQVRGQRPIEDRRGDGERGAVQGACATTSAA